VPEERRARVLVVTDHANPSPELLRAISERSVRSPAQFRFVVPNPTTADLHFLHPERHDRAEEAEEVLRKAMPAIEEAAGSHVIGSVSVRHDPMDAVEDVLFAEPVDEIFICVRRHGLSHRLHQDLGDRLRHYGLPITSIDEETQQ